MQEGEPHYYQDQDIEQTNEFEIQAVPFTEPQELQQTPHTEKPAHMKFYEKVAMAGTLETLDERKRHLLTQYFTSDATLKELRDIAGVTTHVSVSRLIQAGIHEIWNSLPSEIQEEYKSPTNALMLRTRHRGETSKKRMSEARKGVPIGPFSDQVRQNMKKGWQEKRPHTHTDAHKRKISQSITEWHQGRKESMQHEQNATPTTQENIIFDATDL